ncbi:hypothetical protein [Ruegeria arenilitoris]|uniref:hypothetical protein n=1 Tax=Ruegeria arenilitoris TaxID=1173585 RepID=UPI00147A0C2E|nr:hypothetical protein [Ruegeria arenilitoris]
MTANQCVVSWSVLVDTFAHSYEDPFRDLDALDLANLQVVVRVRELLKNGLTDPEKLELAKSRLAETEASLDAAGVDVDWYGSQRFCRGRKTRARRKIRQFRSKKTT